MAEKLDFAQAENVAAIAMHFGSSKLRDSAYNGYIQHAGGFPEFYRAAIKAGIALERVAKAKGIRWGDDVDWILTSENYAESILKVMASGTFNYSNLDRMAIDSITKF